MKKLLAVTLFTLCGIAAGITLRGPHEAEAKPTQPPKEEEDPTAGHARVTSYFTRADTVAKQCATDGPAESWGVSDVRGAAECACLGAALKSVISELDSREARTGRGRLTLPEAWWSDRAPLMLSRCRGLDQIGWRYIESQPH